METLKSYIRILGLFLATSIGSSSIILCYDQAFMDHAMTRYTASFGMAPKPVEPEKKDFWKALKDFYFGKTQFRTAEFPAHEARKLAFDLNGINLLPANLIDKATIDKLELVNGEAQPLNNLAAALTKHYSLFATELGKKRFIEMLTQPTNDITLVQQRQAILQELVSNEQLLAQCHEIFKSIKGKSQSLFLGILNNDYGVPLSSFKIVYPATSYKAPYLSKRTWISEIIHWNLLGTLSLGTAASLCGSAISAVGGPYAAYYEGRIRGNHAEATLLYSASPLVSACCALMSSLLVVAIKEYKNSRNYQQDYLISTASCLNAMQRLYTNLASNAIFKANCPALQEFVSLNGYSNNHSSDFNTLIRRLETDTFKGEPSSFSLGGRIASTAHLLFDCDVRKEFMPAVNALAELDVLVTIARKIKKQKKYGVHYCFVEFSDKTSPSISATNFWNPFVDPSLAVTNNFTFGPGNPVHNVILTGPNTGGKSTTLKALMLNEILAHTFGIAAADKFVTTKFSKLSCHMNITDDTAGGKSLFQAELDRAKELVTMLRELPTDQFAFIIIDEIFTGTAPDQAEDLSYRFIKQLSQFKNCIFISATHFKKLVGLEAETAGACKNFHMGVIADAQGQVTKYTYTITPGPSTINNAQQLAKENNIFF